MVIHIAVPHSKEESQRPWPFGFEGLAQRNDPKVVRPRSYRAASSWEISSRISVSSMMILLGSSRILRRTTIWFTATMSTGAKLFIFGPRKLSHLLEPSTTIGCESSFSNKLAGMSSLGLIAGTAVQQNTSKV